MTSTRDEPPRLRDIDPNCRDLLDAGAAYRVAPAVQARLLDRVCGDTAATDAMTKATVPSGSLATTGWIAGLGLLLAGAVAIVAQTRPSSMTSQQPMVSPPFAAILVPTTAVQSNVDLTAAPPSGKTIAAAPGPEPRARRISLAAEMVLLDRAAIALRRADPKVALASLTRYLRAFPKGVLREEAEVIAIEALGASGRHAEAHAKAVAFLRARPRGVLSAKVRALAPRLEPAPSR